MRACVDSNIKNKRAGFRACEDGSLTIFSLFLFILILMIAGTAVDLIRHERNRVAMQNTLDTAVLAASSVGQNENPEDVVRDYVEKAGFSSNQIQISTVTNTTGAAVTSRSVIASSIVSVDTMFMDLMGIERLDSTSYTAAEERNTKIEIALVLDISGSMNDNSAQSGVSKIQALKTAAKDFVEVIFDTNDPQDVVISIIPYNQQVAMPDGIRNRLSLNGGTVTVTSPPSYPGALSQYELANSDSRCLVFEQADFETRELTSTGTGTLSARFLQDYFYWAQNGVVQQAYEKPYEWAHWCNNVQPRILAYSNSESDILTYINSLTAYGATAINIGMNWGTAMLDPAFQPVVQDMVNTGEIPAELNIFPTGYGNPDSQKYVILMTDGKNTQQYDLDKPYKSGPTRIWYAASETAGGTNPHGGYYVLMPNKSTSERWYKPNSPHTTADDQYIAESAIPSDAVQLDYHELYERFGVRSAARFFFGNSDTAAFDAHYNNQTDNGFATANANTDRVCDRAKTANAITVYTVAFEANSDGETLLKNCATAPGFYFDVDGTQISDAFSAIANQIALLRLTE